MREKCLQQSICNFQVGHNSTKRVKILSFCQLCNQYKLYCIVYQWESEKKDAKTEYFIKGALLVAADITIAFKSHETAA